MPSAHSPPNLDMISVFVPEAFTGLISPLLALNALTAISALLYPQGVKVMGLHTRSLVALRHVSVLVRRGTILLGRQVSLLIILPPRVAWFAIRLWVTRAPWLTPNALIRRPCIQYRVAAQRFALCLPPLATTTAKCPLSALLLGQIQADQQL